MEESEGALTVSMDKPSVQLRCCKKPDHCDWISGLPDEILVTILDKLDTKTAVSTSLVSRRWRHLWRFLSSFCFSEVDLPENLCRVRLQLLREALFTAHTQRRFMESLQCMTGLKRDTALKRLFFVFAGSKESEGVINDVIASAIERGIEDIDVACVMLLKYEYVFPLWLFSDGRGSSLSSLCLSYCNLNMPPNFKGFSSLTKLALFRIRTDKCIDALLANCKNLVSLHLVGPIHITSLRLPKLREFICYWWFLSPYNMKVDTPALQILECTGAALPTSEFKSLANLEHVSLEYDYPDPFSEENKFLIMSACFPNVRSLVLRYKLPQGEGVIKLRKPLIFKNLKVLTLNIRTKRSDDLLWMAMFLVAAPLLETLQTTIRYFSSGWEEEDAVVWNEFDFVHNHLKEVKMYNFTGRDNEISFARLLLSRAPNVRSIAFNRAPFRETIDRHVLPLNWPKGDEFCPRDNQFVFSELLKGISSGARVLFM